MPLVDLAGDPGCVGLGLLDGDIGFDSPDDV
jgi:hypothetical protein